MFFTMQQSRQYAEERRERAEERRQWMERMEKLLSETVARAEQRQQEEAARAEQRRQEENAFMERMFDAMMVRLVESLERIERRSNGNGNGTTNDA